MGHLFRFSYSCGGGEGALSGIEKREKLEHPVELRGVSLPRRFDRSKKEGVGSVCPSPFLIILRGHFSTCLLSSSQLSVRRNRCSFSYFFLQKK